MNATIENIAIHPPLESHKGGQFWVNELIGAAQAGLCKWDEVKPYMHRISAAAIQATETRKTKKWKAGQIMTGQVNHADDYGTYLLID